MKIAILSRNQSLYSTRRIIEAAEQRGHDVEIVDYLKCQVIVEKGKPIIYYHKKRLEDIDAIVPRIGASRTFFGSAVVRQFELMGVFSTVSSQAIVRSRDKLRSLQILAQEHIGLPKTAFASGPEDVASIIRHLGGTPIIIKLLEGTQGKGVVLAESVSAAKSALDAFYGLRVNIMIQEYIQEAKGSDLRAFIVNGVVVGSMMRTSAEGEFRSNLHMGGTGNPVKLSAEEKKMAVNAAKALGLKIAGVDLLRSNRGPLVMEVNSSPGLEGIEKASGKDIAGKIIQFIEDQRTRKLKGDKVGH
ncbi:MAG: 30S ribosomal protein S6--L-glutamate ligase [Bacteroidia bacterium]